MSRISQMAIQAKRLMEDEAFISVIEEIKNDAKGVFLNANSAIDEIVAAHEKIKAAQYVLDTLAARITAWEIETKRQDRHRAND